VQAGSARSLSGQRPSPGLSAAEPLLAAGLCAYNYSAKLRETSMNAPLDPRQLYPADLKPLKFEDFRHVPGPQPAVSRTWRTIKFLSDPLKLSLIHI
jgi:hypothetical protein